MIVRVILLVAVGSLMWAARSSSPSSAAAIDTAETHICRVHHSLPRSADFPRCSAISRQARSVSQPARAIAHVIPNSFSDRELPVFARWNGLLRRRDMRLVGRSITIAGVIVHAKTGAGRPFRCGAVGKRKTWPVRSPRSRYRAMARSWCVSASS